MKTLGQLFAYGITLAVSFLLMASHPAPLQGEYAVIINAANPINTLTVSETKLYYLRKLKKRWVELNKNIRPADRKHSCPEQEVFYRKVLEMSALDVEKYFTNKQLQSAERPPDKFASDADMINFVALEAGAIGYVNLKSLTPEVKEKVKVVLEF
jgi:ABC-type phosphate transport system substrate-binding protein